jgi:hypothetical protein
VNGGSANGGMGSAGKSAMAGAAAGGSSSGGASAGGSGGGGVSAGGAGATVTWTATDYASRKWARWPIPNSPTLNLPHPMNYTEGNDGVTDTVTGLVWEKSTNTATTTWQAALDYCTGLGAGWSLPTRIELTSILDNARSGAKTAAVFTYGKSAGWTWASTPWVVDSRKTVDPPLSWFINFSQGDSNNSLSQLAASAYARCVKIPTSLTLPAQHYTVANGEVKDNYTGLTWQQAHSGDSVSLTLDQATSYCTSLALNAQTWRLPSLNELASVVDDVPTGNVSPAVDHTTFPMTATDALYWTASPYGTSTTENWMLNFLDGFTSHHVTSTLGIARCVR